MISTNDKKKKIEHKIELERYEKTRRRLERIAREWIS